MASATSNSSSFLLLIFFLSAATNVAFADVDDKFTHLHFYFHETNRGPNSTVVLSVNLHQNSTAPGFGDIGVFDNALREGLDPSSALIGRAQGMAVFSALDGQSGLLTTMNLVLTAGEYNGSTLALLGLYKRSEVSDRSIVGGSGRFRMARGYALSKVVSSTATTLTAEFDVYVMRH